MRFVSAKSSSATAVIAGLAVVFMLTGAQAQSMGGMGGGGGGHRHQQKTDQAAAPKPKVDEKAYAAALKTLPDKKYDPWHNVR